MNILISGSDGFVSANLIPHLSNHKVIALDYLTTSKPANISEYDKFINFDLSMGIPPIFDKLDLIIHLATINQLAISANPSLVDVNTSAIHNVLRLARENKARLIFSSSCSIYGDGFNLKEDDPLNPQSLYGIGKCYEEQMIRFYHKQYGVSATILRFSNCYGDTTRIENKIYPGKKDVIRIFIERMLGGKPVPLIHGMGRDYTYIDDVIRAIRSVMHFTGLHIFNVGTGVETLTDKLPIIISDALKLPVIMEDCLPRDTDNIIHRYLNIDKISPYWKPKYSLEEGIKLYVRKM